MACGRQEKYSCKIDEDIFMSCHVWDYMIENLGVLDSKDSIYLTPLLSTGIPSCEYFIDMFFNFHEASEIKQIFYNTNIPNIWGGDYSILNEKLNSWSHDHYYKQLEKVQHYYRGMHPVRISEHAQNVLIDKILQRKEKLFAKHRYSTFSFNHAYFCNSVFCIKTELWRSIIHTKSLYVDDFDEVPLNKYRDANNLKGWFIANGFAVHPAYNTIGDVYHQLSAKFYDNL